MAPKVVILGSGYGGAQAASDLQKSLGKSIELTVIEKKRAFVNKMASGRAAAVGPNFAARVVVPNEKLIKPGYGTMLYEEVVNVSENHVQLANDQQVPFDYLICATGARNFSVAEPDFEMTSREEMLNYYKDSSDRIRAADRIVIVGGGAVGIEIAGEIVTEFKDKDVTIVNNGQTLLSSASPPPSKGFFRTIERTVKSLGINVYNNHKLNLTKEDRSKPYIVGTREYTTDKGFNLTADLVLICVGARLHNSMYKKEWKNDKGQLRVNPTLQLVDHPNIFAVGDINDVDENKMGFFARRQANVAAANVKRLIRGRKSLSKYGPGFGTGKTYMFVSVGRNKGTTYMGYLTLGSTVTRMIKSAQLFVSDYWTLFKRKDMPKEIRERKY